jgi:hypothetical protein
VYDLDMGKALKVAHEDVEASWVSRIRERLEEADLKGARKLVAEALEAGAAGPRLERLQKLVAPTKVSLSPIKGFNRSAELRWLEQHWKEYEGQWVAILGEDLVAHAETLDELLADLKAHPTAIPPILHYLRAVSPR